MNSYKRWFQLQSDNYMKSLDKIKELEEKNNMLQEIIVDIGQELSDEQLENVKGGMSEARFERYMVDLINEWRGFKLNDVMVGEDV